MLTFDCSLVVDIPDLEIQAKDKDQAKRIYIEAIKRFMDSEDCVQAIELEEVAP